MILTRNSHSTKKLALEKASARTVAPSLRARTTQTSKKLKVKQTGRDLASRDPSLKSTWVGHIHNNLVEELSDFENQVEQEQLENDFFVDMAPAAIFVPRREGDDKTTQMNDRADPDLFDFDVEILPILQVLVGKALELARIEVLEEDENMMLARAKAKFQQMKEAELMNTQRVEASRFRKNDEIERRALQIRTQRGLDLLSDKRAVAANISKTFLTHLKRDSLKFLVDLGNLRSHKDFSVESELIPQLLK